MDPAFSYSFQNQKRDLSDMLNTINKGRIGFISLFGTGEPAKSTEVEWLEDSLQARTLNVSGNSSGTLTITSSSVPVVGMLIQPDGKPDVFYVSTVTSATSIGVTLAGNNGGSLTAANAPTGLYRVISTPMNEGTHEGEGNNHQSEVKSNHTQIWRKEAALTRTAIQTAVYGLENTLDYQVKVQLDILSRELNAAAFFGQKVKRTGTTYDTRGQAGGLYYFAAGAGGLSVNAGGATLDDFVCNDGAQKIQDARRQRRCDPLFAWTGPRDRSRPGRQSADCPRGQDPRHFRRSGGQRGFRQPDDDHRRRHLCADRHLGA